MNNEIKKRFDYNQKVYSCGYHGISSHVITGVRIGGDWLYDEEYTSEAYNSKSTNSYSRGKYFGLSKDKFFATPQEAIDAIYLKLELPIVTEIKQKDSLKKGDIVYYVEHVTGHIRDFKISSIEHNERRTNLGRSIDRYFYGSGFGKTLDQDTFTHPDQIKAKFIEKFNNPKTTTISF